MNISEEKLKMYLEHPFMAGMDGVMSMAREILELRAADKQTDNHSKKGADLKRGEVQWKVGR